MKAALDAMSLNIDEFTVDKQIKSNYLESMQYTLQQNQIRFNQLFDYLFETFAFSSNKTIYELFAKQQKG